MSSYLYIWAFHVRPGAEAEFERHYGPDGTWVALFRQAPGYLDTRLLKDRAVPGRYVTIDRWESEGAYRAFRERHAAEHDAIDRACEALTFEETPLGAYDED
ncbi:MAG: antibiotic biosynthesis monooxygenase family protein [Vicinamibacterales bacterium]|nr:antibiotic biosynthesis monooxygenase family protein [Vicinamibacterales bacterium]